MNAHQTLPPQSTGLRFRERLAALCVLGWILASALSHAYGLWSAVGGGGMLLGIAALAWDRRTLLEQLRPTPRLVGIGTAAGVLMIAATYLIYPFAQHLIPEVVPQTGALYATFGQQSGWRALLILPFVAAAEDIVWRGAVQNAAVGRWGPVVGTLAGAIVYSAAVIPVGSPLLIAIALGCGLYWAVLKTWTGSIVTPLIAHLLWDVVVFVAVPLS